MNIYDKDKYFPSTFNLKPNILRLDVVDGSMLRFLVFQLQYELLRLMAKLRDTH